MELVNKFCGMGFGLVIVACWARTGEGRGALVSFWFWGGWWLEGFV